MTPRGTLGLCCVHIAQLTTHPAIYEVKNFGLLKIVGLAITKANTKKCGFCVQRIAFVINQIKGNIKNYMWQYHQHIVQKYHTSYILIPFKILFLNIYLICC